eukprot:929168_1
MFEAPVAYWLLLLSFIPSKSQDCTPSAQVICITGQISYNDWFYTQYDYGGCYDSNPYYYNTTNGYYIYWDRTQWKAYSALGSAFKDAYDDSRSDSLFSSNGEWVVESRGIILSVDPCLEIHPSSCSEAVESTTCGICTMESSSICITGQTSYNDWFYTQYDYGGCYGTKPYYYNVTNGHYIYWDGWTDRWQSNTILGSSIAIAHDSNYPYTTSLFSSNGQWEIESPTIGDNVDPCLEIHSSSCAEATVSSLCDCNSTMQFICITGQTSYNDWFYTQ